MVNRTDCGFRQADPFFSRLFTGLRGPKQRIRGSELAGVVEAVGADVREFEVGDEVFGLRTGAHAEYVCVREAGALAHKPAGMTFEEAAAVCDGTSIALACLRKADLRKGRSIVIYGASGSIGTAAVQLAKHFEADVTGVCNTKNVELVRSLARWIGDKRVTLPLPRYTKQDVVLLKELIEAGKYRAVIDRSYPLEDVVEATRYVETRQKTGNVVLTVSGTG